MNRKDAGTLAKELIGTSTCISHRNVWAFETGYDSDTDDLIITKDNAVAVKTGVFFDKWKSNGGLVEAETGIAVSYDDVFGKNFYEDDPTLETDNFTDKDMTLGEKINCLLETVSAFMRRTKMPPVAAVMLNDFFKDDEETAYRRLTVLSNYLAKCTCELSLEEFSYLHHELMCL